MDAPTPMMKAIVYERYGPPETMAYRDVPRPVPGDDEIVIKIEAVSLNRSDWEGLIGTPLYARLGGLRRPKTTILGSDIAGTVVAAGSRHERFRPGDAVYGDILARQGGFAEYVCVRGITLNRKPDHLTFEEAAALPQAGVIALRGIVRAGQVQAGQHVLINGAGGGAGSFAIQMAKRRGATVTGVDNAAKLAFMRSLGADEAIDYAERDFTKDRDAYDLILDLAGHRSIFAYRRALKPGGLYLYAGGSMRTLLMTVALGWLVGRRKGKQIRFLNAPANAEDLETLANMTARGEIAPVIAARYPLAEVPAALREIGAGRALGKIVIAVSSDRPS